MYTFKAMTKEYANHMIEFWKYEAKYEMYDYVNEAESLLDQSNWGFGKFAVLKDGVLVGELTTDFFRPVAIDSKDDGYVSPKEITDYDKNQLELWIGFGLDPKLTSKGLGKEFIKSCINFAISFHHYNGEYIRLGVSSFNERAIKTYKFNGFEEYDTYKWKYKDEPITTIWMRRVVKRR
jgi:RimJ/RimL family protein N-acetyltransferase